jgi:hypothetical protein
MSDLLDFLNTNSGALTVVFTGIVTLATAVYAGLTWALVSETRRMRQVQTEPKIEITLRTVAEAIHIQRLHVRNIGLGAAIGIRFRPRVVEGGGGAEALLREFTETNFFASGIGYLGPGEERYSNYTQMSENHDQKIASVLCFDVTYDSATGRTYAESIFLNMAEQKGNYQLGTPDLHSIAKSLEQLQKDIHNVLTGFKRIRTDVFSSEDRQAEKQAIQERIERERAKRGA